jgi:GNAT superfamily N-acetyltransferase
VSVITLHDRDRIEAMLRRDTWLNLYGLGDLDTPFWDHTSWYARLHPGEPEALALLYSGLELPTLLALGTRERPQLAELLRSLVRLLPLQVYGHLSPGLAQVLEPHYHLTSHGLYLKMALTDPSRLDGIDTSDVESLKQEHADELVRFYDAAYPGHWFEPVMLATGWYYGIRSSDGLVSAGGIHVYSARYRVAALGNVATLPDQRRRGLSTRVTAHLCRELLARVKYVGLNVRADNQPAIHAYRRLGFEEVAQYEEWMAERR